MISAHLYRSSVGNACAPELWDDAFACDVSFTLLAGVRLTVADDRKGSTLCGNVLIV